MTESPATEPQVRQRDWAKIAVITIGAVLAATLLVVILLPRSTPSIDYRVVSIDLRNQKLVHVTIEVLKAPLAEAKCEVAFFDGDGRADGRLTGVIVPPRADSQRRTVLTLDFTPLEPVARASVAQCVITRTR